MFVDTFTDGLLGPDVPMAGPVADGGHIVWNSTPGCWGPMITPSIRGGHEVCTPVAVEGAEVGDAIAIRIKDIAVTSTATSSGNDQAMEGRFNGDPYCAAVCPGCGSEWPETRLDGIGETAVRCAACGADCTPFTFTNGYTIAFDEARRLGVTVDEARASEFARDAATAAALPDNSTQNPILTFAPHDIVGLVTRMRPFLGQCGTSPSTTIPDSHNAGDFGAFLVGAPHRFALDAQELARHKTDGHLDIDAVRAGAILVCPVKVPGGGVYLGDMHAMQGDGEIAGHTTDVAGTVTLQVEVIKGLGIDGPVLFPVLEDLPFLAKPLTASERAQASALAARAGRCRDRGVAADVGDRHRAGPQLGDRQRARARRRVARDVRAGGDEPRDDRGAIEIGRAPGVVQVTFRAPVAALESARPGRATPSSNMPERSSYEPGTPSWVDLTTPDVEAACAFYGELFGWDSVETGPVEETGGYRFFLKRRAQGRGRQPDHGRGPAAGVVDLLRDRRRRRARDAGGGRRRGRADGADGRHGRRADGVLRPSRRRDVRRLGGARPQRRRARQRAGQPRLEHARDAGHRGRGHVPRGQSSACTPTRRTSAARRTRC